MGSCRLSLLDKNFLKTIAMVAKMGLKKRQLLEYLPKQVKTNMLEPHPGTDLIFA